MQARTIDHMFHSLTFNKTASQITSAATKKTSMLRAKIYEREKRIADLRAEYSIDDAALVQLLTAARKQQSAMSFSYNTSNASVGMDKKMEERTVGAGVVNNLLTENDFIQAERDQVKTLELIARNLQDIPRFTSNGNALPAEGFSLTMGELEYLGF